MIVSTFYKHLYSGMGSTLLCSYQCCSCILLILSLRSQWCHFTVHVCKNFSRWMSITLIRYVRILAKPLYSKLEKLYALSCIQNYKGKKIVQTIVQTNRPLATPLFEVEVFLFCNSCTFTFIFLVYLRVAHYTVYCCSLKPSNYIRVLWQV